MTRTQAQLADRAEAIARLHELVKPGDTLYTVLCQVARSGMSRRIDVYKIDGSTPFWLSALAAKSIGMPFDYDKQGVRMQGCGTDMGFELVYNTSQALFPKGFGCIGQGCPSSDHSTVDRDYTPHGPRDEQSNPEDREPGPGEAKDGLVRHWHTDGGYALRQRWL